MTVDNNGNLHGVDGRFEAKPSKGDDADLMVPPMGLRTVKGLARLLYRMGRTFDGLNTSRLATEDFLRTGNPRVIGSRSDYALLCDLKDAARYVLDTDWTMTRFDMAWLQGVNGAMTRTAAMMPGVPRDAKNIIVSTPHGIYTPPIPDVRRIDTWMREADAQPSLESAARLFARLAKAQPFGDGNKRSALLAANGLLDKANDGRMLAVPVDDPDRTTFNRLLGDWYLRGEPVVIGWLAAWNRRHPSD